MAKFPYGKAEALLRSNKPMPVTTRGYKIPTVTGPTINRGKGNNAAGTPMVFVNAVEAKFGPLACDLAATAANKKASHYVDEATNSLSLNWHIMADCCRSGLLWLNPPFTNITVWAKKCAAEVQLGARILLLVPASVGANWYWDWVAPFADVYSVGRMVFDDCYDREGKLITTPYPKDLVLAYYNASLTGQSYGDAQLGGRAELIRWRWQDGP